MILDGLKRFIDSLSWTDIFDLGDVWDRAKRIFTDPIGRLISFGVGVVSELLDLVKQAILRPLAALAEGTAGYDLLKAILGQDPITGDPVPRNADTLIGGFMKLIGQEEVWQNIKRGNAVARAFAWFQGALAGLMGFVRSIPGRIVATLAVADVPGRGHGGRRVPQGRVGVPRAGRRVRLVGAQPGDQPAGDPVLGRRPRRDALHRQGQGGVPHDPPQPGGASSATWCAPRSSGSRCSPATSSPISRTP